MPLNFPAPSQSLLLNLLKKCSSLRHLQQIHAHVTTLPFFPALPLLAALVRAYILVGHLCHVHHLLLLCPLQSQTHLWNMLLQAYSKSHTPHRSLQLFVRMLPPPDNYTYTFVITSCSQVPASETGEALHGRVLRAGFHSDIYVGNTLVGFYSLLRRVGDAHKVFDEMPSRDVVTWTSLVNGFVKNGELGVARELFDRMEKLNEVTWAVMIAGYVGAGRHNDAMELFHDMLRRAKEPAPNEAVLVSVLSACAHLGALEQGKWIHAYIDRKGVPQTANVATALIDMYSKCGRIDCAKQIFWSVAFRDVFTWTAMISGLAMHGLGRDALRIFDQMVDNGFMPDEITLLGVLKGCSHSGLVDEGCSVFHNMNSSWRIAPTIEHYGCFIDLLGRASQLEKAVAIVLKMPMEPDIVVWRALLSACRVHQNVELGECIIDHVSHLDLNKHGGGHVLLSNLYASVGRWEGVVEARTKVREGSPSCSWIEVDGVVHEFLAADRRHPQIADINNKLTEVLREARLKGGYVANTKLVLFDLSEEDKEQAMYWHSEKLTVAFGLMTVEVGLAIRIVKNLRICEDCHSAMKAISLAFGREIVVRDPARFHYFDRGKCSCMDYW